MVGKICLIAIAALGTMGTVKAQDAKECKSIWTPGPVQTAEAGSPAQPSFHTVFGVVCGRTISMFRMTNALGPKNEISIGPLPETGTIECTRPGKWANRPIQFSNQGTPSDPRFHTVWPYTCDGKTHMIRFTNQFSGKDAINVQDLGGAYPAK